MASRFLLFLSVLFFSFPIHAADYGTAETVHYQTSTLRGSIGLRYWYSQSHSDLDTGDFHWNSVDGVSSHTAELVGELEDTQSTAFARAYVGLGKNVDGEGNFRSYPSGPLEETTLAYVVVDGGWRLAQFANDRVRLKGFVGYQFLNDGVKAEESSSILEQTRHWHAIRLGMTVDADITERIGVSFDAAAVPWSYNRVDTPWSATRDESWRSAWTYGFEADAMLNVDLTQNWQVGVGGRYWWLQSNFDRRYISSGDKLVYEQNYQRYGLLLESKYQF